MIGLRKCKIGTEISLLMCTRKLWERKFPILVIDIMEAKGIYIFCSTLRDLERIEEYLKERGIESTKTIIEENEYLEKAPTVIECSNFSVGIGYLTVKQKFEVKNLRSEDNFLITQHGNNILLR